MSSFALSLPVVSETRSDGDDGLEFLLDSFGGSGI